MKKIRFLIIIVFVIIIILSIIMMILKNLHVFNTNSFNEYTLEEDNLQNTEKIEMSEIFNIRNCINMYRSYSYNLKTVEEMENDGGDLSSKKEYYNRLKEQLINIIPDFVKEEMALTEENIYKEIAIKDAQIRIREIDKYITNNNVFTYLVKGTLIEEEKLSKKDFRIIVIIDNVNNTFLAIPNEYIELKNISEDEYKKLYTEEQIQKNEFNEFSITEPSYEAICRNYFAEYKLDMIYDSEFVYSSMDKDYKEKRFGTFENFEKYIQDNSREINQVVFSSYMVNNYEDYTEYVCRDQYKNLYIFKETAPMEFTLTLDTYTLPNEKFTTTYETSDNQMKVMMNIDKWIQMLNNRDYNSAYNVLDETFRQNNFGSVEKFEEYMRENLPLHYDVKFTDFSDQGQNYVQDIELTDITKENTEVVTKSIVMRLGEETDFVMSFKIQ